MRPSIEDLTSRLESGALGLHGALALRKGLSAPFRRHPLGFAWCNLVTDGSRKVRLHFWPRQQMQQDSLARQIHDHIFSFRSWILAGSVENIEYAVSPSGTQMAVYRADYEGESSILRKTSETLAVEVLRRQVLHCGQDYAMQAGVLHETCRLGVEAAVTILVTQEGRASSPLVVGPVDGRENYSFRRSIIEEEQIDSWLEDLASQPSG